MGVSAIGQRISASTVRHVTATIAVFVALFYFFYGPPLTPRFAQAAHEKCNRMTGSEYRNYRLVWETTTYSSVNSPHWVCFDLNRPDRPGRSIGWWAGL